MKLYLSITITFLICCGPLSKVQAEEYRITTVGDAASSAVQRMVNRLHSDNNGLTLSFLPGIAGPGEMLELLDAGIIDIAVVAFPRVPSLAQSPLLKPFMAQNAVEVRQAIDSEVGAFEKTDVEQEGYRVLDFWHVSSSIFGSKNPILEAQDLRGLKVRQGTVDEGQTLLALGAAPVPMPFGEVFTSLQKGSIDSSAVPFDNTNFALGFTDVATHYVDRLYVPSLYAVLISKERWADIPYPDQHHLAKAAEQVGEDLVGVLQLQAQAFRTEGLTRGAVFNVWAAGDVADVRVASLSAIPLDRPIERELVNLAFANAAADPAPPPDPSDPRPEAEVSLLYATDRQRVDLQLLDTAFSSARRLRGHDFGVAKISLKAGRKFGDDLEDVSSIYALDDLSENEFLKSLRLNADRPVVIFIHGYNNSFADSMRRGATIQEDIAKNSTVISYTWPSDGELLSYGYDESSTDIAEQNFKLFMDKVTGAVDAEKISIIAHSMGSRLLTKYLASLPERSIGPNQTKFNEIIFAAADISTTFFKQKEEAPFDPTAPISSYALRTTVYSSQYDRPLGLSKKLHRDQRLGLADQSNIYVQSDIMAIDASLIDPAKWYQKFSFATRHSYVFDKAAGVRDLSRLLKGEDPATRPGMAKRARNQLEFWVLSP